ncbi:mycothione reductase [soil metagenome]
MSSPPADRHHDLVIIGSGSGNSIPSTELEHLDIALVEGGTFGGTCLNVGCIPTKMFVHPAHLAAATIDGPPVDVRLTLDDVNWPAMRDRIFGRIDPISHHGREYRAGPGTPNVTLYSAMAHFVGPKLLDTGAGSVVSADRFVIAAGSRAVVPPVPGLELGPRVRTSDTIMRLDELPRSTVIIGGGFIAAEFAAVFHAFGVEVHQLALSGLLKGHDASISAEFTRAAAAQWHLHTGIEIVCCQADDHGVTVTLGPDAAGEAVTLRADVVLVGTGRQPNSDRLDVAATGVATDDRGYVLVDEFQRTNVEGIFALGDVSSDLQLKHVANHEMRVVRHNLAHPDAMIAADHRFVPSAVFTSPQIAMVGITEREAIDRGIPHVVAIQHYGGIAAGWAREDTTNFLKVLADPRTGFLLGAHAIGPEAATVIQPLIQAMSFGQRAHDVARGQYWIHPALSEIVENALLALPLPTLD